LFNFSSIRIFYRKLETWIDINASCENVWKGLIDFGSWQNWNGFIPKAEGNLLIGEYFHIEVVPPGLKKMTFRPRIFEVVENSTITWGGGFLGFVYQGSHHFILEKIDENRTRFRQIEYFKGPMVLLMTHMINNTKLGYLAMNESFKKKIENNGEVA